MRVNGEEIVCTGEHPFYILNVEESRKAVCYEGIKTDTKGKWVQAKDLKATDRVLLLDGSRGIIDSIETERLKEPEVTYNFEIEDFHTYYVGKNKVLVHNRCQTKLYRAMSDAEYGSLTKHGKCKHKLGTMQDKWMATTYDDAVTWGNRLMGKGNFRVVEIRVSISSLNGMNYANYALDGIGKAYSAHYNYPNEVMVGFGRLL